MRRLQLTMRASELQKVADEKEEKKRAKEGEAEKEKKPRGRPRRKHVPAEATAAASSTGTTAECPEGPEPVAPRTRVTGKRSEKEDQDEEQEPKKPKTLPLAVDEQEAPRKRLRRMAGEAEECSAAGEANTVAAPKAKGKAKAKSSAKKAPKSSPKKAAKSSPKKVAKSFPKKALKSSPKKAPKSAAKSKPKPKRTKKNDKEAPVDEPMRLEMCAVLKRWVGKDYDRKNDTMHKSGEFGDNVQFTVYWGRPAVGIKVWHDEQQKWQQVAYFSMGSSVALDIFAARAFALKMKAEGLDWCQGEEGAAYRELVKSTARAAIVALAPNVD